MTSAPAASTSEQSATRRRVLTSSTIGSTIEWYDFSLYSTAAAPVLGPLVLARAAVHVDPGEVPNRATVVIPPGSTRDGSPERILQSSLKPWRGYRA